MALRPRQQRMRGDTLSRRCTRPTGNCRPALLDLDVGFFLSSIFLSMPMVPLAPLPAQVGSQGGDVIAMTHQRAQAVMRLREWHEKQSARLTSTHPTVPWLPFQTWLRVLDREVERER